MGHPVLLYGRATSSCTFRVRIALNLAQVSYETTSPTAEEQGVGTKFAKMNPQGLVPFLVHGDDRIAQSLVIIEYIIDTFSTKALLPSDTAGRARARALAQYVVSEIQPLQNTRLDAYMKNQGIDSLAWKQHWIKDGLQHIESELASPHTGTFCHGDSPTIADCCLIPQVYNAMERYNLSMEDCPNVMRVYKAAQQHQAFKDAWPDSQPDYEPPTD